MLISMIIIIITISSSSSSSCCLLQLLFYLLLLILWLQTSLLRVPQTGRGAWGSFEGILMGALLKGCLLIRQSSASSEEQLLQCSFLHAIALGAAVKVDPRTQWNTSPSTKGGSEKGDPAKRSCLSELTSMLCFCSVASPSSDPRFGGRWTTPRDPSDSRAVRGLPRPASCDPCTRSAASGPTGMLSSLSSTIWTIISLCYVCQEVS